ncbi:hypothetical protein KAW50_00365 [candidate division WOR-3 bacterium]|nr:hypothetical protein [candidate division WOR-3 bacterium]
MQKFSYLLLATYYLLLTTGCGKKQPVFYEQVKPREGEIKLIDGWVDTFYTHSEFANMSGATYLFAGEEAGFEALAFLYFEFDSAISPESLWVTGEDSGQIQVCKLDSINMDSVDWSNRPELDSFNLLEIREDTALPVGIQELGTDSVFYIGFSDTIGMTSFYSSRSKDKTWFTIGADTCASKETKSTYIDTSYFSQDSLPDSKNLTYIETGAYVTKCTLYLNTCIIIYNDSIMIDSSFTDSVDIFKTQINSLTNSLGKTYSLDSATVNKAEFKIWIDTTLSYKWDIEILAQYEVNGGKVFSRSQGIDGDSLVLSIESIIEKWFKEGEKLWIVLEGDTKKISRVILDPSRARLSVTYTLPPKER